MFLVLALYYKIKKCFLTFFNIALFFNWLWRNCQWCTFQREVVFVNWRNNSIFHNLRVHEQHILKSISTTRLSIAIVLWEPWFVPKGPARALSFPWKLSRARQNYPRSTQAKRNAIAQINEQKNEPGTEWTRRLGNDWGDVLRVKGRGLLSPDFLELRDFKREIDLKERVIAHTEQSFIELYFGNMLRTSIKIRVTPQPPKFDRCQTIQKQKITIFKIKKKNDSWQK